MSRYQLDLVTLLVANLPTACAYYHAQLGFEVSESGALPKPLALKLGRPDMVGADYAGIASPAGGARLRLIGIAGAARLVSHGWGQMRFAAAGLASSPGAWTVDTDPDLHPLSRESRSATSWRLAGVTIQTESPATDAAFYQGLLGISAVTLNKGMRLQLGMDSAIDLLAPISKPVAARPLACRLRRAGIGGSGETIPELTALARCLAGPQDEIIELI